jgi:hypothetical protein
MVCLQLGAVAIKSHSLRSTKGGRESQNCAEEVEELKVVWDRGLISTFSDRALRGDFAVLYGDLAMAVYKC